MNSFEYYYFNIIKYDLINKFNYKNLKDIPKIKKIILNFGCKTSELKNLSSSLLALQLITKKKGELTVSKQSNIILRIRKGNPVGCKVTVTKTLMYKFLTKVIIEIIPRLKNKIIFKEAIYLNSLTYSFENLLTFKELEKNYLIFSQLKNLQITVVCNTKKKAELFFLLNSFKF